MDLSRMLNTLILGAGGALPHVSSYDIDSGKIRTLIDLPHGHSVYSIDIDFAESMIAMGTRGGLIKIVSDPAKKEGEGLTPLTLIQGAPLLSICWIGKAMLAASDSAGRCLLWKTDYEALPEPLEVKNGYICCLTKIDTDTLAGLSSTGDLHFWHLSDQQLFRVIKGPCPPPIKALVHMVYWPGRQALAWPSQAGHLGLFDPEKDEIELLHAHEGEFYAILEQGDNLLTAGMRDSRLKIWNAAADKPVRDYSIPGGIISMGTTGREKTRILFVGINGIATCYSLEKNKVRAIREIQGKDYRTITSPSWKKAQALHGRQRTTEIEQILTEIQSSIGRAEKSVIEALHTRLTDLGYEHVSLAVRADQASQSGDMVEAIRFSSALMNLLPKNTLKTCPSMEKYAGLLQEMWHFPEADALCKRIMDIDPGYPFTLKSSKIEEFAKIINGKQWLIDPDIPIEQVIKTATIIRRPFSGRYVIKTLQPENSQIRLDPEAITKKYEQLRKENGKQDLPSAVIERLVRISKTGVHESAYMMFGDGKTHNIRGLQMVLQILPSDLGTVVMPVILFDWRDVLPEETVQESNERAEKALNNIRNNASSDQYLSAVYRAAKYALRRILTEKLQQEGPHT